MAGDVKAQIDDDGTTIVVKAESAAVAQEAKAALEQHVRAREGGWGAKFNAGLRRSLERFDETTGIYSDRLLNIIRDVLMVCAMSLAVYAWYRVLPGYETLMCVIGAAIVFGIKTAAGRLDAMILARNWVMVWIFGVVIGLGFAVDVIASTSLQASVAMDQATGRTDIERSISTLEDERRRLNIAQMTPPEGSPAQQQALLEAYLATPMVSRPGAQLTKTVGKMVEETGCKGTSYYVGIYCPTYGELVAKLEEAKTFEADKARLAAIPGEVRTLEAQRPKVSSTYALGQAAMNDWWGGMVIPVGLTVLLVGFMLVFAYLAGRAERTPPLEDPVEDEVV